MRRLIYASMVIVLIISFACTPKQEPEDVPAPPEAPKQEPESAKEIIENYGEGLVRSKDKSKGAQAKVDIREVQRAVQDYALAHDGAYPGTLDDISGSLPGIDLDLFSYDPSNGSVRLR